MMNKVDISEYFEKDFHHVCLENEQIKTVFIPELGGKMVELLNKKTGKQFLLKPQTGETGYRRPDYGADFDKFDTSGFDECFPTIEPSEYNMINGRADRIFLPDHGELWSRPWKHRINGDRIRLISEGRQLQYRLEKQAALSGNCVELTYTLENLAGKGFHYIWSAHPLLNVTPGARILLPEKMDSMLLNWASHESIGTFGDVIKWPYISPVNRQLDYSTVQNKSLGHAVKLFSERLDGQGVAGVYCQDSDEAILFEFEPQKNPYLGVWLCYGGWPVEADDKHLTIGLEPCSGRPDSLSEAIRRNESAFIDAGATTHWTLKIRLVEGMPQI